MMPPASFSNNLNSQFAREDGRFSSKWNQNFSEVISRKYRILFQQFLKKSSLEKKLILFILVGAVGFSLTTLLIIYFGLKHNRNICTKPECIFAAARLLEGMNTSTDPCENFYDYVCGRWGDTRDNPPDEMNSWFIERTRYINYQIKSILKEEIRNSDLKPVLLMKKFYKLCTDTGSLNRNGLQPIYKFLTLLGLPHILPNTMTAEHFNLAKTLAYAQRLLNLDILIELSTRFNRTLNTTLLSVKPASGEISFLISNRDKTMRNAMSPEEFLVHQITYMTNVMAEFSDGLTIADVTREALKIILLDAQLKLNTDQGNGFHELYGTFYDLQNFMSPNATEEHSLAFNWRDYILILAEGLNVTLEMSTIVHIINPAYFQSLGSHLVNLKSVTFQRYVWWKIIDALATHTTDLMRSYAYIFNEYVYSGITRPTRSSVCISLTKSTFSEVISYVMATRQNSSEIFEKVKNIMSNIKDVFKRMISNSDWIDAETKNMILLKVDSIKIFIGYPDHLLKSDWISERYKKVKIIPDDFIGTLLTIRSMQVNNILSLIHTPLGEHMDNISSAMDPTDVNAYYNRDTNSIAIPPGILQYPFYIDGIQSLNYGAIGSILGHELTHGFDSEGKDYDWNGEVKNTWNKNMAAAYNNRSKCFIDQYQQYTIMENVMINGSTTLAENIADNGGIKEAFHAYQEYELKNGVEDFLPSFEKFTHQQLLFISFANIWCKKHNEISLKFTIADEHSPNNFRVIGSLSNLPEFSEIWNCPHNSIMNPIDKCLLW